jgi:hypothetical protein
MSLTRLTNPRRISSAGIASAAGVYGVLDPRYLAGCKMWLDASDASSVTLNSGNVAEWRDKSGNGTHATQFTAASQPAYNSTGLNGRGVVEFDSAEALTWASSTATFNYLHNATGGTIFMVLLNATTSDPNAIRYILTNSGTSTANTGFGVFFDDRSSVSRNNGIVAGVDRGVSGQGTSSGLASNAFPSANSYAVLSVAFDNSNATAASRVIVRVNGTALSMGNTLTNAAATGNATSNLILGNFGGSNAVRGVAEMAFYEGVLSATSLARLESYAGAKWGITIA